MQYFIKNFETVDDKKMVGFRVVDDQNQIMVIDKYVPLVEGKTDQEYIADAYALCTAEINEWQASKNIVGKVFNPTTGTLE